MLILFFFSSTVRSQQAANGQLVSAMPPLRRRSRFIGGVTSIPVIDYDTFLLDIFAVFTDGTTAYKNINAAQSSVSYDKLSTLDIHFLSYERIAVFLFN